MGDYYDEFHFGSPVAKLRIKSETTNGIYIGVLVSIADRASYWNGNEVERWYRTRKWYVTCVDGMKAKLGKDKDGQYEMNRYISTNFLKIVGEE